MERYEELSKTHENHKIVRVTNLCPLGNGYTDSRDRQCCKNLALSPVLSHAEAHAKNWQGGAGLSDILAMAHREGCLCRFWADEWVPM